MQYPSQLATGIRIYVEYDKLNPNLVRVQRRNAKLAIIPAGSSGDAGQAAGPSAGQRFQPARILKIDEPVRF